MKKFAVVISGCGVYDGAEIQESVLAMLAIDEAGAGYQLFAPDIEQTTVVNHLTGEQMDQKRNVLVESARIARGKIRQLSEYNPADYNAILLPGGFGAALNLSSFGVDGEAMTVDPQVENAVASTYKAGKPIGAMCIAPVVVAKILEKGMVTIGNDKVVANAIAAFGATHKETTIGEVVADFENKVFTTPCYMLESSIKDIYAGARHLISEMLKAM